MLERTIKALTKIEPKWNGKSLDWYLIEDEKRTLISLKGNLPEYCFNDTFLRNNRSEEDKVYNNYFIVKGTLAQNEKVVM